MGQSTPSWYTTPGDRTKRRPDGAHPNSLEATADPETRARIAEGRRRAKADEDAINSWASNGCTSGFEVDD